MYGFSLPHGSAVEALTLLVAIVVMIVASLVTNIKLVTILNASTTHNPLIIAGIFTKSTYYYADYHVDLQ